MIPPWRFPTTSGHSVACPKPDFHDAGVCRIGVCFELQYKLTAVVGLIATDDPSETQEALRVQGMVRRTSTSQVRHWRPRGRVVHSCFVDAIAARRPQAPGSTFLGDVLHLWSDVRTELTRRLIPLVALHLMYGVCLAQSPTLDASAELEKFAESAEYLKGSKLVFSKYSPRLTLKPHDNERYPARYAQFAGTVEIRATLWVENDEFGGSAYHLIPTKASEKLLPRVVGGKYASPARVDKLLIENEHIHIMESIPDNTRLSERAALVEKLSRQWQSDFLSQLLGANEANRVLMLKPKVFKVSVVSEVADFSTGVDCDSRRYSATIIAIRLAKKGPLSRYAFADMPKFQGC